MPRLSTVDQAFFLLETARAADEHRRAVRAGPPQGTRARLRRPARPHDAQAAGRPAVQLPAAAGPIQACWRSTRTRTWIRRRRCIATSCRAARPARRCSSACAASTSQLLRRDAPLWEHARVHRPAGRARGALLQDAPRPDRRRSASCKRSTPWSRPRRRRQRVPRAIWEGLRHVPPPAAPAGRRRRRGPAAVREWRCVARPATCCGSIWHQGLRDLGLGRGLATPFVTTPNVLKAAPSPNRVLAHCVLSLPQVRALARAGNAKINDVHADADRHGDAPLPRRARRRCPTVRWSRTCRSRSRTTAVRATASRSCRCRWAGRASAPAQRLADVMQETAQVKQEMRDARRQRAHALFDRAALAREHDRVARPE